ncbi:MAG: hypothetical protein RIB84_23875 [Sneathiellaceae bacterium]
MFPGATIFVLGAGPSLRHVDLSVLTGRPVVAVNYADLYPAADALVFVDGVEGREVWPGFLPSGLNVTTAPGHGIRARQMANTGARGLETWPQGLRIGAGSLQAAANLGWHFSGPGGRVALVGADLDYEPAPDGGAPITHYDGRRLEQRDDRPAYRNRFAPHLGWLAEAMELAGGTLLNATEGGQLDTVRRVRLGDLLA